MEHERVLENERSSCRGLRCRPLNEVVAPGESSSFIYIYTVAQIVVPTLIFL